MMTNKEYNYLVAYQNILDTLKKNNSIGINNVSNAFNLADSLHKGQTRKSGEPYIMHPVAVAEILCNLGFDTDMISAALLHDVVEDCECTIDQIREKFNNNIAEIVDAVTAINQNTSSINEIFDDPDFFKNSLEEQTFKKLISIGKENKFAFFIKFADRLNNLRTIQVFNPYKQIEKVKETQKWIIPLAYLLKTKYFYDNLQNECFRIVNRSKIEEFEYRYNYFHELNRPTYNNIQEDLTALVHDYILRSRKGIDVNRVVVEEETLFNTYERIRKTLDLTKFKLIKRNSFNRIPATNIYVVLNGKVTQKQAINLLYEMFEQKVLTKELKIIGFESDDVYKKHYFLVQDKHRIKYRLCMLTLEEFIIMRNGTVEGTDIDLIDEESLQTEIIQNYIEVQTRSGQIIKLPENSTVLDFAFKIHDDLGLSCKYALVNNSPTHQPLYTKLIAGDKVNIIAEQDANGFSVPIAQIRWLAYVNTERAKKSLIKYFERVYKTQ